MSGSRHLTPRRRAILRRAPTTGRTTKIMEDGTAGTTTRGTIPMLVTMAVAAVIRTQTTQTNTTVGTSMEAARLISSPPQLPMKFSAQGPPASSGLETHSSSRARFPVLRPRTPSTSWIWILPQGRSATTEAARDPADRRQSLRKQLTRLHQVITRLTITATVRSMRGTVSAMCSTI